MYDNLAAPPPHPAPAPWGAPAPQYPLLPGPLLTRRNDHRWLPVFSLVVSVIALMAVLALAAWTIGSGASSFLGGADPTLSGQVRDTEVGAALPGPTLTTAINEVLERDFGHVTAMTCPDTPKVDQGVVTVCHGTIDGDSWAVVVFLENRQGLFTLQLL